MQKTLPLALLARERRTLEYYKLNAASYAEVTSRVDMSVIYARFLRYIVPGGLILDAGSGSGRDTLGLMRLGYQVEAFDASPELCKLSEQLTGVRTSCVRFQDFDSPPRYDGIWACASLLHVPLSCSGDAVRRLAGALKHAGALYISFKYGKGERISNDGRLFTDMDEDGVQHLLAGIPELTIAETWQSSGEGTHNGKDLWLNVITRKSV